MRSSSLLRFSLGALALALASCSDGAPDPALVETTAGAVRGAAHDGYLEFLGIPYAAPPVGDLRFRPPAAHPGWSGTFDATGAPPKCPQRIPLVGLEVGVEDCLVVNVHTPNPMPANAPVLVWIHGGGFTMGEGVQTDGGTIGDQLVQAADVVVVSMNYRLGALGFLAHPELSAESPDGVSGNYGFLDQVAALGWVRDNIARFGGNPDDVTIAGESAGGMSVCAHLVSPRSAGLYHKAIIQSGPCRDLFTLVEGETQGLAFAAHPSIACDGAPDVPACLRAASLADIGDALPGAENFFSVTAANGIWSPVVDGEVFPDQFATLLEAGSFQKVPVLQGWNADEGTVFLTLGGDLTPPDQPTYEAMLADLVGGPGTDADLLIAHYAYDPDPAYNNLLGYADALGDRFLGCSARVASRAIAAHTDTWVYYFTYPDAAFQLPGDLPLGAFHSAEVQYVFGHSASLTEDLFTGVDLTLHQGIRGYWLRFVASGDPNGDGAPAWPEYDPMADAHMILDLGFGTGTGAEADDCAVWAAVDASP